jgi:DNA mismatch repair ATPase MutS
VIDFIIDVFCRDNNKIVAEDYEDYRDSKKISVFEKLFFRYKNEFFFRAEEVANYISMKFKKDVTPSYVIKELSKANLLSYNKEGTSHHLPNKIRKKYDNDKRYSTLNIEVLKDLIIDQRLDFMDYYTSPIKELTPYN